MKFLTKGNSSRMRIGIDVTDITADMQKGGIYHYIVNLFSNLRDIDTENQYILFFNYFLKVHRAKCDEVMRLLEGRNMQIKLSRFPRRLRIKLRIPVNMFIGNIDIFHGPFDNVLPVVGCKRITTIHDVRYFDIYPRLHEVLPELANYSIDSNYYNWWNSWMEGMKKRVYSAACKADHIITVSNYSRDSLIKLLHVNHEKVHTIYNGVSPLFAPVNDRKKIHRITEKYGIDRDYLLFVGHIDPFKNILRMIDAYHIIRNENGSSTPSLVIISPTQERDWFYRVVKQKISQMLLNHDIQIVNNITDEDLPYFYSGATALLLPSLYEGFGLPAIEAMACRTPVIASNTCSLPEVVGDAALLVDPYSINSIAAGIQRILSDDLLREDLGIRGLERSRQFSWEKTARETLKLYQEVYNQ